MPKFSSQQLTQGTDERRKIAVVHCDLVASTELQANVGMESFYLIQKAFLKRALEVAEHFDAEQIRFTGDGLVFALGRTHANEHQVQRGAKLSLELIRSINELKPQGQDLDLRVALASGEAIVSTLDDADPFNDGNISVSGPVMPVAARIISTAEANQVVADHQSARLLTSEFDLKRLGTFEFKGLKSKRTIWLVEEQLTPKSTNKTSTKLLEPIERVNEQPLFRKLWNDVQTGSPKAIWVEGEAGIGKSHLVAYLSARIPSQQKIFIASHPYHRGHAEERSEALAPLLDWLNGLFHHTHELLFEEFKQTCISRQPQLSTLADSDLQELRQLVDGTEGLEKSAPPEVVRQRRRNLFVRLFTTIAKSEPCLVILEDAHWMDSSSAEVFAEVLAATGTQLLLMLTTRPRSKAELPKSLQTLRAAAEFWPLRALSKTGSIKFAKSCLGDSTISDEDLEALIERSDGIPLFIQRLCIAEANKLDAVSEPVKQYQENNESRVPDVLFEVLMSTLDRLPGARAFAQIASIQGREFDLSYVSALTTIEDLPGLMSNLIDNQIVEKLDQLDQYRFHHHLIRDIAYSSLMTHERGQYHGELAQLLLDDLHHQDAVSHASIAAHFEQAANLGLEPTETESHALAAAASWLEAARQSINRSEIEESLSRIHQTESLLDRLHNDKVADNHAVQDLKMAACAERAYVHSLFNGWSNDGVGQAISDGDAIRLANPELARNSTWQDLQQVAVGYHITVGDLERAGEHGRQLEEIAASLNEEKEGRVDILRINLASSRALGGYLCLTGRHLEAVEVINKSLAEYDVSESLLRQVERRNVTNHKATILVYRALSLFSLGKFQAALDSIDEAYRYAQEIGHGHSAAYALVFRAGILVMARDDRMDHAAKVAADFAEEHKFGTWIAPARMMLGHCHAMRQDLYEGIGTIDTAAQGNPDIYVPFGISLIVSAELARGNQPETCLPLIQAAKGVMNHTHEYWYLPETLRLQGLAEAEAAKEANRDPLAAAEQTLRQAHETAAQQGAHLWSLRITNTLADLLTKAGRQQEANHLIVEELVHFDTSEQFPDLEDARQFNNL